MVQQVLPLWAARPKFLEPERLGPERQTIAHCALEIKVSPRVMLRVQQTLKKGFF